MEFDQLDVVKCPGRWIPPDRLATARAVAIYRPAEQGTASCAEDGAKRAIAATSHFTAEQGSSRATNNQARGPIATAAVGAAIFTAPGLRIAIDRFAIRTALILIAIATIIITAIPAAMAATVVPDIAMVSARLNIESALMLERCARPGGQRDHDQCGRGQHHSGL
jgi:hypothetical protein